MGVAKSCLEVVIGQLADWLASKDAGDLGLAMGSGKDEQGYAPPPPMWDFNRRPGVVTPTLAVGWMDYTTCPKPLRCPGCGFLESCPCSCWTVVEQFIRLEEAWFSRGG